MAITIVSTGSSGGQPSAPFRLTKLVVTPDASYPTGGYDVTSSLPAGGTVVGCAAVQTYDGSTLRWAKINASTKKVQMFINTGGAPGVEVTAAVDVHLHASIELLIWTE
jgi:hypothetical protein